MSVFRLKMLPASEGDCLILSYGPSEASLRHVVIDGGRKATWPALSDELQRIAHRGETVELLLLSHIDADHIDGLLALAEAPERSLVPNAVWYNGYDQFDWPVPTRMLEAMGYNAADGYSKALKKLGWAVNEAFGGKLILLEGPPAPFAFAGLTLTLLSPDRSKLEPLQKGWREHRKPKPTEADGATGGRLQGFGKRPFPPVLDVEKLHEESKEDTTVPNGSSIALVAEYDGRRVLLGADAHPDQLVASLSQLVGDGERYPVNLVKVPHHGSRANVTRALVELVDCGRYAFSTSGSGFGHPDPEAIARILKFSPMAAKTLYFNYASDRTTPWDAPNLKDQYGYACVFPGLADVGLVMDI